MKMTADKVNETNVANNFPLPLRCELGSALHFLKSRTEPTRTGLDIGFANPDVSARFREEGGYWMTVASSENLRLRLVPTLGEDSVLTMGKNGELPFEDKQFDVVVLANGMLPADGDAALQRIIECHRVLKPGGHLIFTVNRLSSTDQTFPGFNETTIFQLLRDGFDVTGLRNTCRFFVRLVNRLFSRKEGELDHAGFFQKLLYGIANGLDFFLFFGKGHQMTFFAHRKGWRNKRGLQISESLPVSNAVLYNIK